jgi:hypothetical protein
MTFTCQYIPPTLAHRPTTDAGRRAGGRTIVAHPAADQTGWSPSRSSCPTTATRQQFTSIEIDHEILAASPTP